MPEYFIVVLKSIVLRIQFSPQHRLLLRISILCYIAMPALHVQLLQSQLVGMKDDCQH